MKSEAGRSDCTGGGGGANPFLHESSGQRWGPIMHRSAGNRVVGSTHKHRCVTGLTKTTSESELERSRPVMDAHETETRVRVRVRGGGPRRAAMKHWAPASALPGFHHDPIPAAQSANREKTCLSSH